MTLFKSLAVGALAVAMVFATSPALAQTAATTEALLAQLESLLEQVRQLQAQITSLQSEQSELAGEIRDILAIDRSLHRGLSGEDVKLLQQILKTDPEIYPEGLVTGFFGPLTEKAVKRFQKKFGIDDVGVVGPITRSRLNQLLTEGAGNSGQVPPGLLIAPGIAQKFGDDFTFSPLPGQALPPGIAKKLGTGTTTGTTTDTTAPIISNVSATSTTASTTRILWETNESTSGTVWYDLASPVSVGATTTASSTVSSLSTAHDMLIENLTASTTYHFVIEAKDVADNVATSTPRSFTTSAEEE